MYLQEVPLIKDFIIEQFDKSDTLKQAINSTMDNFKDDIVPSIYDLVNTNVFKYKYPRTLENVQKVIISICVNLSARPTLRDADIYIYIYTHVDLMQTTYGITRTDYIQCQIDKLLNDSKTNGFLGELSTVNVRELPPIKDWVVTCIEYKGTNLNFPIVKTGDNYD
jgi:hypothetical protein